MWTHFWDMHSGGGSKEKWGHIYIEAEQEEAKKVFYSRFGHNPERVSCACCGEDYSISSDESLEQLTGYHRNCGWDEKTRKYIESCRVEYGQTYLTLEDYKKEKDVLFISSEEIKEQEKHANVPGQGYVWVD